MTKKTRETFTLRNNSNGNSWELPLLEGTVGPKVIDVRRLYADTNCFTYDPGFTSTGSCESKITFIDGDKGVLLYRGYPIDQLANHSDYLEVCYLLLYGELPNNQEKTKFVKDITNHTMLHEQFNTFFHGFRRDAHPMAVMCGVVGALSAFYHDSLDINDPHHRMVSSYRLIAKIPTIAAQAYKYSIGQPFISPRNDLKFAENFLHMMFATPAEDYTVSSTLSRAMDRILILHADHEQNASTSTVRLAGSSGANPFACIAAGIASLWGPAHGGANEAAMDMINQWQTADEAEQAIMGMLARKDKIMGFGHAIYRTSDPRNTIIKAWSEKLAEAAGDTHLYPVSVRCEEVMWREKKLFCNADFFHASAYNFMGIPTKLFTPIFVMSRVTGWAAHVMEQRANNRIIRPSADYIGPEQAHWVAIEERD